MSSETLRVLVMFTEGAFVAQCLEHDISVQAEDLDTLQSRFEDAVHLEAQSHGGKLDDIEPAPPEFFDKWEDARELGGAPENAEMRLAA